MRYASTLVTPNLVQTPATELLLQMTNMLEHVLAFAKVGKTLMHTYLLPTLKMSTHRLSPDTPTGVCSEASPLSAKTEQFVATSRFGTMCLEM